MSERPTIGQVIDAIEPDEVYMPDMLGREEARRIQQMFPDYLDEALNALGQSRDDEYDDLHLEESHLIEIVESLIRYDNTAVTHLLESCRRVPFTIDQIEGEQITFDGVRSAIIRSAASAVHQVWAKAYEEKGVDLTMEDDD